MIKLDIWKKLTLFGIKRKNMTCKIVKSFAKKATTTNSNLIFKHLFCGLKIATQDVIIKATKKSCCKLKHTKTLKNPESMFQSKNCLKNFTVKTVLK